MTTWTKRQLVEQAYGTIGLAAYVFDLSPEQVQNAVRLMDTMMATWNENGIRVGYSLPDSANGSDPDDPSGLPDRAIEAVYLNLGLRIAPGFGKTVSVEHKAAAKNALNTLSFRAALPPPMQLPGSVPMGAGNRTSATGQAFTPPPTDPLLAGQDSAIEFD